MTDGHAKTWRNTDFRKSSFSAGQGECVEIAHTRTGFALRDSKRATSPVLAVPLRQAHTFLAAVKTGKLAP